MTEPTNEQESFDVDGNGFLRDPETWSEAFAHASAASAGIQGELTQEHWDVIRAIRSVYASSGRCPLVYQTSRMTGLGLGDFQRLFPSGYQRGACRLAGLSFRDDAARQAPQVAHLSDVRTAFEDRVYRVDVRGFLVDPADWDEAFAANKAREMKMPEELGEQHWRVLRFLREACQKTGQVPRVYDTCAEHGVDLTELERLFPDGYHRGAVKLAGLRVR